MKKNILLLCASLFISFLMLEIALRIIPFKYNYYLSDTFEVPDDLLGESLRPDSKLNYRSSCFQINDITINKSGFRDGDFSNSTPDVLVLGDSFVEGRHVPDGTDFSSILEKTLKVDVWNAGISGLGTIHEYLLFERHFKGKKPPVVLLGFFPENDLSDTSYKLAHMINPALSKFRPRAENIYGKIVIREPAISDNLLWNIRRQLKKCYTCKALYGIYLERLGSEYNNISTNRTLPVNALVYTEENPDIEEAWLEVDYFIARINADVKGYGGKLIIFTVPSAMYILNRFSDQHTVYKDLLNMDVPYNRLKSITDKYDIPLIKTDDAFAGYINDQDIRYPFFFYRCDGHWNPLGHFLAANYVGKFLLENDIIFTVKEEGLSLIQGNMALTPQEVLGPEGYQGIYSDDGYYNAS